VHAYLIDTDPARRAQVHKQLSGRSNMVVRAYRDYASFLAEADLLDAGCVILSDDGMDAENRGGTADAWLDFIRQSRQKGRFACILLTREGNMRFAIDAMKAGAVDCLLLSHTQHALLGTVEDALALVRAARAEQGRQQRGARPDRATDRPRARCAAWPALWEIQQDDRA
jgi:FixJ family two-component response regulator